MRYGLAIALVLIAAGIVTWTAADPLFDRTYQIYENGRYWAGLIQHWRNPRPVDLPTFIDTQRSLRAARTAVVEYRDRDGYEVLSEYFGSFGANVLMEQATMPIPEQLPKCGPYPENVREAFADLKAKNLQSQLFAPHFSSGIAVFDTSAKPGNDDIFMYMYRHPDTMITSSSIVGFDTTRKTALFYSANTFYAAKKSSNGHWKRAKTLEPCGGWAPIDGPII